MTKTSTSTSKPKVAKKANSATKNHLLGVINHLAVIHGGPPPRDLVARQAGYGNGQNPSFKKALSRASKRNHVDLSDKETVSLTEEGQGLAGDVPKPPTNEEAQEEFLTKLSPKMQEAFRFLQDGKPKTRVEIAEQLKYDNAQKQGFKKLLIRIREKGFLEFVDKESVQLADICFPNGRNSKD